MVTGEERLGEVVALPQPRVGTAVVIEVEVMGVERRERGVLRAMGRKPLRGWLPARRWACSRLPRLVRASAILRLATRRVRRERCGRGASTR